MIDTDKYEGHTPGPWRLFKGNNGDNDWWIVGANHEGVLECGCEPLPNDYLMADAPLLLAEVKRLREDNELYLACIHASHFRNKPGSAMNKLNQVRFDQGRLREHIGAVRCIYGKNPQSFVPVCEECGFPVDPYNERFPPGADCICDLKEAEE